MTVGLLRSSLVLEISILSEILQQSLLVADENTERKDESIGELSVSASQILAFKIRESNVSLGVVE